MDEEIKGLCRCDCSIMLKDRTWILRGGMVDYWLKPDTVEELERVGKTLFKANEPFVTIGHTSNTYFKNTFNIKYVNRYTSFEELLQTRRDYSCMRVWSLNG